MMNLLNSLVDHIGIKYKNEGIGVMKAIIFDFDGTLANTLPICYDAFQNVFKNLTIKTFLLKK